MRLVILSDDVRSGMIVDPWSMFDIIVKRIHEHKRQHLNVLHIMRLYHRLKRNPSAAVAPVRSCSAARRRRATSWRN